MKWLNALRKKRKKEQSDEDFRRIVKAVAKRRADVLKDLAEYDRGEKNYSAS